MTIPSTDERLQNWCSWVEDLFTPVTDLVYQMQVWRSWNQMLAHAPDDTKTPPTFHAWVSKNYVDSVTVGVRGLVLTQDYDRSLMKLLYELKADTANRKDAYEPVLTREWFFTRVDSMGTQAVAEAQWAAMCDESGERLATRFVQADIGRLKEATEGIRRWTSESVAHLKSAEERAEVAKFSYADLHDAINAIWGVQRRWRAILTDTDESYMLPSPWERNFTASWLTNEQAVALHEARQQERRTDESDLREF